RQKLIPVPQRVRQKTNGGGDGNHRELAAHHLRVALLAFQALVSAQPHIRAQHLASEHIGASKASSTFPDLTSPWQREHDVQPPCPRCPPRWRVISSP